MSDDRFHCFISYVAGGADKGRSDLPLAEALYARLTEAGFKVWLDKKRLNPGCDWHKEIETFCEASRIVLPILTPRWKISEWTRYETYGHAAVIPLLAEGSEADILTPPLRRWQGLWLDPLTADEDTWQALFTAIHAKLAEPVPERAKRLIHLAHDPCAFFTGRDNDLVRIHEELHEGPVAALTQGRVRALAAMGGIGKTTLANEYARRYWRLYPQIFWVDARRGYEIEFAVIHDLLFPGKAALGLTDAQKAGAALQELTGPMERLLVLDNVEDEVSARPWIPRTGACRTLITSRFADWPQAAGVRTIHLYVLDKEPARQFLLARTGRTAEGPELAACDELADKLGRLPLALEQAAAYIAARMMGFAEYLREYEHATTTLLAKKVLGSTHYPDSVITTWQTTITKFSPLARSLLRLCCCLAETPIPASMFLEQASSVYAYAGLAPPANELEAKIGISDVLAEELARYSMIQNRNAANFQVHGLVQTVEWITASDEERKASVEVDDSLICRTTAENPHHIENFHTWEVIFPHVEMMARKVSSAKNMELSGELLGRAGAFEFGRRNFEKALDYVKRGLEAKKKEFGSNSAEVGFILVSYGETARVLGHTEEAEKAFKESMQISENLGLRHRVGRALIISD